MKAENLNRAIKVVADIEYLEKKLNNLLDFRVLQNEYDASICFDTQTLSIGTINRGHVVEMLKIGQERLKKEIEELKIELEKL